MDENNYNNILFFLAGAIFSPSQEVYTVWHENFTSDDVLLRDAFKASDSLLLLPRPRVSHFGWSVVSVVLWACCPHRAIYSRSSPTKHNGPEDEAVVARCSIFARN